MNEDAKYPIKYISLRTGLSQILIRTWENRYNLLEPQRTKTNRRLYTEHDLQKLLAIKKAMDSGFKIGELSKMSLQEIKELIIDDPIEINESVNNESKVDRAIDFIKTFDSPGLKRHLDKMLIELPKKEYITDFIIPLLHKIGTLWEKGEIRISNEHFASAIISNNLGALIETYQDRYAPVVISCTPRGQNHELMALSLSVIISTLGFRVVYIGASVPAEEIISTSLKTNAVALVLSIIHPSDDYSLYDELKKIEQFLSDAEIYMGGSSAETYFKNLKDSRIILINDINSFIDLIQDKRKY